MAETGRMAVFHGTGKPFEIREYPVPDPEPGAILIKIALANICGSDLHYWRGELDYKKMGRPLPLNTGHEHVGTVAKLGPALTSQTAPASADQPNVRVGVRSYGGATYVIAVNAGFDPVQATMKVPDLGTRALDVLDESRTVLSLDGSLSDSFEPLGVHVYIARPQGA